MAALSASLVGASSALADTVSIQLSNSSPEQGIPLTLTFSGTGAAIDSSGDGPYLYAVVRPSGGIGCQATYGEDQAAAGAASTTLMYAQQVDANVPFSLQANFDPGEGGYIVCAWLETVDEDYDGEATPNEVTAGPITSTFDATSPKVGALNVSPQSSITPGDQFAITYATQTDQNLSLDSVVVPAGGAGCASSYELETNSNLSYEDVFGGSTQIYGSQTTTGDLTEDDAGAYVICTWVEGPNNEEVDATASTAVYVGTPPSAAPPSTAPTSTPTTTVTAPACVVPRSTGVTLATAKRRIRAGHCTVGRVYYVRTRGVRRGRVIKLGATAGRRLKHGTRVAIIVSLG